MNIQLSCTALAPPPLSPAAITAITASAVSGNHLAPPSPNTHHHQVISPSGSSSCSSTSVGSLSPRDNGVHHSHHGGCPSGCSGAVPRKPLHMLSNSASASTSSSSSSSGGSASGTMTPMMPTHTYPGRRHVKSRLLDLQNRLPPIKEFRSPAKVPHPSPVNVSNPRFRWVHLFTHPTTPFQSLVKFYVNITLKTDIKNVQVNNFNNR